MKTPGTKVDHSSYLYGHHLQTSILLDVPTLERPEGEFSPEETTQILLRGLLTAFFNVAKGRGLSDEQKIAMLEAAANKLRTGQASADAKQWRDEILAEDMAAHPERYTDAEKA